MLMRGYLKRKRDIKDQCDKLRDEISMNLYYYHRAHHKLSGSKLLYVTRALKRQNQKLYNKIKELECKGRDEIHLTLEPNF